jgi:hypothetical protein
MLHLEHNFVWCWNLDTSKSRSEITWKVWNMVLEKDGAAKLDWSVKIKKCQKVKEGRNILHTIKWRKANWIAHILHRNFLLKHVFHQFLLNKNWTTCWSIREFVAHMSGCFWQIVSHRQYSAWTYCS